MIKINKFRLPSLKNFLLRLRKTDFLSALAASFQWLLLAALVGVIVGTVSSLFAHTLSFVNGLRTQYPALIFGLPAGGLLIVFLYRVTKNADDRGTNTVLYSIRSEAGIPFKMAPLIFVSTAITHLFGGSAGREGPAVSCASGNFPGNRNPRDHTPKLFTNSGCGCRLRHGRCLLRCHQLPCHHLADGL